MTRSPILNLIKNCVLTATRGFKRVCYFGSWATKRAKVDARMDIDDIDPFMCTHLIYAFAKMNVDSLTIEGNIFKQFSIYFPNLSCICNVFFLDE